MIITVLVAVCVFAQEIARDVIVAVDSHCSLKLVSSSSGLPRARYVLGCEAGTVWTANLPFIFDRVRISGGLDRVFGYAYTKGLDSRGGKDDYLVLAGVYPDGGFWSRWIMRSPPPAGLHDPGSPFCVDVDVIGQNERVLFRLRESPWFDAETWMVFSFSGEFMEEFVVQHDQESVLDVAYFPGLNRDAWIVASVKWNVEDSEGDLTVRIVDRSEDIAGPLVYADQVVPLTGESRWEYWRSLADGLVKDVDGDGFSILLPRWRRWIPLRVLQGEEGYALE